jgi:antitoxin (DNA-binding transcriptional repressor) of toxin-antitoxin stability system
MEATTKDLRLHTRELIAATDRGEEIVITFRGQPRALLTALKESPKGRAQRNPAFGLWADTKHATDLTVDEQVRKLRKPRDFG